VGPAGDRVSDDAAPLAGPGQEPRTSGGTSGIGGAVILPQSPKGERREAHMRIDMGGNYAEIHTAGDETHRTRLAVLMPRAGIVKLARAIVDRS
jgi:hypothetical protein